MHYSLTPTEIERDFPLSIQGRNSAMRCSVEKWSGLDRPEMSAGLIYQVSGFNFDNTLLKVCHSF